MADATLNSTWSDLSQEAEADIKPRLRSEADTASSAAKTDIATLAIDKLHISNRVIDVRTPEEKRVLHERPEYVSDERMKLILKERIEQIPFENPFDLMKTKEGRKHILLLHSKKALVTDFLWPNVCPYRCEKYTDGCYYPLLEWKTFTFTMFIEDLIKYGHRKIIKKILCNEAKDKTLINMIMKFADYSIFYLEYDIYMYLLDIASSAVKGIGDVAEIYIDSLENPFHLLSKWEMDETIIVDAKKESARKFIKLFNASGHNINDFDKKGKSALHVAFESNRSLWYIKLLVEYGADPNLRYVPSSIASECMVDNYFSPLEMLTKGYDFIQFAKIIKWVYENVEDLPKESVKFPGRNFKHNSNL